MLVLSHVQGDESGLRDLFAALSTNQSLKKLDVSATKMTSETVAKLGAVAYCHFCDTHTHTLSLFSPRSCSQMLEKNQTLRELDVSHNSMNDEDIAVLVRAIRKNMYLTCLRIDRFALFLSPSLYYHFFV